MALDARTWSQRPKSALIENYPALARSIPRARQAVKEFAARAGADEEALEGIELAASEAITNVVLHAYPDRVGEIYVAAHVMDDELWLMVGDDGDGLHARRTRPSPGLGLGLGLIAQMSDDFSVVERGEGGVELRMRFDLAVVRDDADYPRGSFASAIRPASPRFSTTM